MDAANEIWKPVVGFEGLYSVSSFGRVRSEPRIATRGNGTVMTVRGRVLKPYVMKSGYHLFDLRKDNAATNHYGHVLVLTAFVGERPPMNDACHNNGIRGDNRLENLRWDTRKANHADKHMHGTASINERSPACKLTNQQVSLIRQDKRSSSVIAREYGVCFGTVCAIRRGDNRKYV